MKVFFKLILVISLIFTQENLAQTIDNEGSQFYFLMDHDTKEVLLSKNADVRMAPSSMTKIMTAYVVFDQIKKGRVGLDNECLIGKDAWKKRGSSMFLNYGDVVTIDNLLKGLLAVSGNDAAIALSQSTAGGVDKFVALMNFKARELGLKNSNFRNPHGLNEDGHYMSIRDLAILLSKIYEDFPEYSSYLSIEKFTFHDVTQPNSNPLIKHHYDGLAGGKTGYTNDGGYGVVASVKRGDRRLIAVVNKAKTIKQRARMITQIFDYGFDQYKKVTLFTKNQKVTDLKMWMGNKAIIGASTNQEISFNLPRNIDVNKINVFVDYQAPLYAPIAKGSKVATLIVKIDNYKTMSYSLFASEKIDKAKFLNKIWLKVKNKILSIIY